MIEKLPFLSKLFSCYEVLLQKRANQIRKAQSERVELSGYKTCLGHAGNGVDFKNYEFAGR